MNKMAVAVELVKIAKSLTGASGYAEPLEIRVRKEIFKETGFDAADFEDEVSAIVRRHGYNMGAKASGSKYPGQWTWTWDLPKEANKDLAGIKQDIRRMPEWRVLSKYGAIIEIGQN